MQWEGNGWYQYTLSGANCANFIFSNNGGSQSPDLSTCQEVWYTEGQWGTSKTSMPDNYVEALGFEVEVFPVPATDVVHLRLQGATGEALLQVFDPTGKVLHSKTINGEHTLPVENLAAGVYFYRVTSGQETRSGKIHITQ